MGGASTGKGTIPDGSEPGESGVRECIRGESSGRVAVGVLGDAEVLWLREDVEALTCRRGGSLSSASEVPHAEDAVGISGGTEGFREGQRFRGQGIAARSGDDAVVSRARLMAFVNDREHSVPWRVLTGEEAGPEECIVQRTGAGVREGHPLAGETVEIRGIDEAVSAEAGVVSAHVIGKDEHSVRLWSARLRCGGRNQRSEPPQ